MKRQLIAAGLIAFALLLFTLIAVSTAAPRIAPIADIEPDNNTFDGAETIAVPANVTGVLTQTGPAGDSQDYYVISRTATIGSSYRATLSILYSQAGMGAEITLYHGNTNIVSGPGTTISWSAITTTYYILVESKPAYTTTAQLVSYRLRVDQLEPTSAPPPTPLPTTVSGADAYETYNGFTDNNQFAHAFVFPVTTYVKLSTYLGIATFHTLNPPGRDVDYYKFWGKNGKWYRVTTSELSAVDTYVDIYRENTTTNITHNDDGGGGYASLVSFQAPNSEYYYIKVTNKVNALGSYNMTVEEIGEPAPGATATPGPGPTSGADSCEDNADFGKACVIAANDPKTFNFVPPYGGVDNDFFKMWIKPGFLYECSTSYLDAGVDPNLIVFTGPSWDNAIGGNDDVEPGDLNSYFSYYSTYTGWLYLLVGYGDRTPSDVSNSNYTFECKMTAPGEPTRTPGPTSGTVTAVPIPTNPPSTATPAGLTVRSLTTPTPVPDSGGAPESQFMRIKVVVYYDANGDGEPGAGEGIAGISVKAYEAAANQQLAQQFTDEQGYLEFTVSARGPVRVSIPFFGFSQLVSGEEATIRLRVPSQALPGGEPQ